MLLPRIALRRCPPSPRFPALLAGGLLLAGCHPAVITTSAHLENATAGRLAAEGFGSHARPAAVVSRGEKAALAEAYAGKETPNPRQWTPLQALTPVASGEGLVVCEPVSRGTDGATADFGAGCSQWLALAVGGMPQLGKTPLLTTVGRVRTELGKKDLRLEPADAARLAATAGATRVLTGEMTGDARRCTLTYQLYDAATGKVVGAPLRVEGAPADVIARLPETARQVAAVAGVEQAGAPAPVGLSPDELSLLARLMYRSPDRGEVERLERLAPRCALAGLLLFDSGFARDPAAVVKRLMEQAGDNPLILGHVEHESAAALAPYRERVAAELKRFPRCYALAHANVWLDRALERPNAERAAAELGVRAAPRNPEAWLSLGWTTSSVADTVRRGRVYDAMDPGEQRLVERIYTEWLSAVQRACELDPLYGHAWLRLAEAGTFAGQNGPATDALWKAVELSPEKSEALEWGLQMFQPKWMDDRENLQRVADAAVKAPYATQRPALDVAKALQGAGLPAQALALRRRVIDECTATRKREPENLDARYFLGVALWEKGDLREAAVELQPLAREHPENLKLLAEVGDLMEQLGRTGTAIQYFRELVRRDPKNAYAHASLGWDLKHEGKLDEAEREARESARLDPKLTLPLVALGEMAEIRKKYADAARYYRQVLRLDATDVRTEVRLAVALGEQKQYGEAERHCERAIGMAPEDERAMAQLGYLYAVSGKSAAAVKVCRRALELNPNDVGTRENLGEALCDAGRKAEGCAELERVAASGEPRAAAEARKALVKYRK